MRTEKNIILIRHAKWLWDDKQTKKAKECIKQAYENDNFRSTRNWQNNNVVKSSRPIYSRRNKA